MQKSREIRPSPYLAKPGDRGPAMISQKEGEREGKRESVRERERDRRGRSEGVRDGRRDVLQGGILRPRG